MFDDNGDTLSYTLEWYVNGELRESFSNPTWDDRHPWSYELGIGQGEIVDVYCKIEYLDDGYANSLSFTSNTVTTEWQ